MDDTATRVGEKGAGSRMSDSGKLSLDQIRTECESSDVRYVQLQFVDILGIPKCVELPLHQLELITRYGCPRAVRSDNGSELLAEALRHEMRKHNIRLANIDPGKPWQNGSNESFNATFRKECLNAEIFASLTEARVIIEQWRRRYNERRPYSSQNYITPDMAYFGLLILV